MKTIIFYLYCAYKFVYHSIVDLGKMKKYIKEDNQTELEKFFRHIYSHTIKTILDNAGVKVEAEGQENIIMDGPVVFIANHQGNFDVVALVNKIGRKVSFIGKKELKKIPLLGSWMLAMGCLFIDRSNIRQSAEVITEAVEYIKKGNAMLIFPEGTRSKSSNVGEFKAGSFKIATKAGAPIIPISIDGSYKIMEANKGKIINGKIKILFHKPVETKDLNREEISDLHNKVKQIIEEGVKKLSQSN